MNAPLRLLATSACALGIAAGVARGAPQGRTVLERFTAMAVNMGDPWPVSAGAVEIVIHRWSTEAEREALVGVLMDRGSDALLSALQDAPAVGYIRTPNSLGYDLHFAGSVPGDDGGRRVILATDRPIGFWEAVNRPRSIEYPFTIIELRLNADGEGEGKMSIATRITGNKQHKLIDIEDYATQPVRLLSVRSERPPTF
jgi:hypothetical protein